MVNTQPARQLAQLSAGRDLAQTVCGRPLVCTLTFARIQQALPAAR